MTKISYFAVIISSLVGGIVFFILSIPVFLSDLIPTSVLFPILILGAFVGAICAKPILHIPQLYQQSEKGQPTRSLMVRVLKIFLSIVVIFWLIGSLLGALLSPATIIGLGNFSSQTEPLKFTFFLGFWFAVLGAIVGFIRGFFWLISQP